MGYSAGVEAYQLAAASLSAEDLSAHYTRGLTFFEDELVPHLKRRLSALSGDVWSFDDYVAYAAGSDVDLMTHIIEGVAAEEGVAIFPDDWYGFLVGATQRTKIQFNNNPGERLAALCLPSVRNGHLTKEMVDFVANAKASLLNINLYPTVAAQERKRYAQALLPMLDRALLSVSFSRGFGLTASQLGVLLIHKDHPMRARFHEQWRWFTYFYNALAARAFMSIDLERLSQVDAERREWVHNWLKERGLPVVDSGTYYVRSFRVVGALPERLSPLVRGEVVRLCMKPPQV